jgi:hypothetical protein
MEGVVYVCLLYKNHTAKHLAKTSIKYLSHRGPLEGLDGEDLDKLLCFSSPNCVLYFWVRVPKHVPCYHFRKCLIKSGDGGAPCMILHFVSLGRPSFFSSHKSRRCRLELPGPPTRVLSCCFLSRCNVSYDLLIDTEITAADHTKTSTFKFRKSRCHPKL